MSEGTNKSSICRSTKNALIDRNLARQTKIKFPVPVIVDSPESPQNTLLRP